MKLSRTNGREVGGIEQSSNSQCPTYTQNTSKKGGPEGGPVGGPELGPEGGSKGVQKGSKWGSSGGYRMGGFTFCTHPSQALSSLPPLIIIDLYHAMLKRKILHR